MSFPCRTLLAGLTFTGALAVLGYVVMTQGLDLSTVNGSDYQAGLDEAREQGQELEERRAQLFQRLQTRRRVVAALIDGRLTLPEAAAWFLRLESSGLSPAAYDERASYYFAGKTREERLCRKVIEEIRATLEEDRHEPAGDVVRRLEAELQELLQGSGVIRLPEAPPTYRFLEGPAD
jgi:hypothetical protein